MTPMQNQPCQCQESGFCPRWGTNVTNHLLSVCQSSGQHRELWERQGGPFGQVAMQLQPEKGLSAPVMPKIQTQFPQQCRHLGAATGKTVDCLTED